MWGSDSWGWRFWGANPSITHGTPLGDLLTQEAVESLEQATAHAALVTQEAVEVLASRPLDAGGLTQLAVELLVPVQRGSFSAQIV